MREFCDCRVSRKAPLLCISQEEWAVTGAPSGPGTPALPCRLSPTAHTNTCCRNPGKHIHDACENSGQQVHWALPELPFPPAPLWSTFPAPPSKRWRSFLQCFPITLAFQRLEEISVIGKPGELIVHFLSNVICKKKNVERDQFQHFSLAFSMYNL